MENLVTLSGIVQRGQSRGKTLGFPTINFALVKQVAEGIYCSQIEIENKTYNALTFIGTAQTFNETSFQAETYVFDFDQDVYGQKVTVTLLKKLRDSQKFDSEEALKKQMELDKKQAEDYFKRGVMRRSMG